MKRAMKVLVTGAGGYVGATVVSALLDAGDQVVGLDDLSRGRRDFLTRIPHIIGDIADPAVHTELFTEHPDVATVVHCAARTIVDDSVADPLTYYQVNVAKTIELLDAMIGHGVRRVVFSSSAAVYGAQPPRVVAETDPVEAASPYAAAKLMIERVLTDVCTAEPVQAVSLRYFNPVGADPQLRTGRAETDARDVLTSLLSAARDGRPFVINGDDWDTDDGTPLRDFVHVADVARAHVAAVHLSDSTTGSHSIINIGSGRATTVRALADVVAGQLPEPLEVKVGPRRAGDTVGCRADIGLAAQLLGWRPTATLDEAVRDALRWAAQVGDGLGPADEVFG